VIEDHNLWDTLTLVQQIGAVGHLRDNPWHAQAYLNKWELEEIVARLKSAGCDRGPFMTKLFAVRLACLGMAVESRGIGLCRGILNEFF
jgi:hypothetical protein